MRPLRRALAVAAATATVAVLAGCTPPARTSDPAAAGVDRPAASASASPSGDGAGGSGVPTASPDPSAALGTVANPVRVAIVGDSLTAGVGHQLTGGLDENTWMTYAEGDGVDYVGGWAKSGATVEDMAANVKPLADVDVLVLMAGTNDVNYGVSFAKARPSYDAIVATVKPKRVILGEIPPFDRKPSAATAYDAAMVDYARSVGWDVADPWHYARDGALWASGTSKDGVHPTTSGTRLVGSVFRAAVLELVQRDADG